MCRPCRPSCSPICFQTAGSTPVSVSISSRTADSGDLLSRKLRTVLRSSSCSSVKAKFMPAIVVGGAALGKSLRVRMCTLHAVKRVGIRQLRADAAALVRSAEAGEQIVVTVAGHGRAQLGPIATPSAEQSIDELIAKGLLIAPRRGGRPNDTTVAVWGNVRLDRLLREVRG